MKKTFSSQIIVGAMVFVSLEAAAQAKLPPASSMAKIEQGVGIKTITLTYHRPNANGRTIFGDLVPYDQVWRTGANQIPVITFQEDVTLAGNRVPAGTYGIFTIPAKKGNWTVILTKNINQWGAYQYKEEEDLLRFPAKQTATRDKVETFTMAFENTTPNGTDLTLAWENTKVSFSIAVDQSEEIMASIDAAMKGDKKPYFAAAQYYYTNNLDIKKAVEWVNEADKAQKAPYIKYWRSRILLKAGDKAGAAQVAQEGIEMAKGENNPEYVKLNTQALKDAQK